MRTIFFATLLLVCPRIHAQSTAPSSAEVIKAIRASPCAQEIKTKKKKALEADCQDCATDVTPEGIGLDETVKKVRDHFAVLDAEEDKARIKREIAFFKSKHGMRFMSRVGSKLELSKQQNKLAHHKKKRHMLKGQLEQDKLSVVSIEKELGKESLSEAEKQNIGAHLASATKSLTIEIERYAGDIEPFKSEEENNALKAKIEKAKAKLELIEKADAGERTDAIIDFLKNEVVALKESIASAPEEIKKLGETIVEQQAIVNDLEKKAEESDAKKFKTEAQELASLEREALGSIADQVLGDEGYRACGMSVAEAAAIRHYTAAGYSDLNQEMREGADLKDSRPMIDVLNSALRKLKRFSGAVKRGADIPKEVSDKYQVGEVLSFPAFTSTSISTGFSGNVRFVIHSRTGRYIGMHSNFQNEDEVLIPAGSKFKVLDRQEDEKGNLEIVLSEIDPKIRPLAKPSQ